MRLVIEDETGNFLEADRHKESEGVKEKRVRFLRKLYHTREVMMIPIFGSDAPKHWNFFVIEKMSCGSQMVKYFDSRPAHHAGALRNAKTMLKVSQVNEPAGMSRQNFSRQVGIECGFFVCHWLEEHLRAAAGQGLGSQPWPEQRITHLKGYLRTW